LLSGNPGLSLGQKGAGDRFFRWAMTKVKRVYLIMIPPGKACGGRAGAAASRWSGGGAWAWARPGGGAPSPPVPPQAAATRVPDRRGEPPLSGGRPGGGAQRLGLCGASGEVKPPLTRLFGSAAGCLPSEAFGFQAVCSACVTLCSYRNCTS